MFTDTSNIYKLVFVILYILQFIGITRLNSLMNTSENETKGFLKKELDDVMNPLRQLEQETLLEIKEMIRQQRDIINKRLDECIQSGYNKEHCLNNDGVLQELRYLPGLRTNESTRLRGDCTPSQPQTEESFTIAPKSCPENSVCYTDLSKSYENQCFETTGLFDIVDTENEDERIRETILYNTMLREKMEKNTDMVSRLTDFLNKSLYAHRGYCVPMTQHTFIRNTRLFVILMLIFQLFLFLYYVFKMYKIIRNGVSDVTQVISNVSLIFLSFFFIVFSSQIIHLLNSNTDIVKISTKEIQSIDDMYRTIYILSENINTETLNVLNETLDQYKCVNMKSISKHQGWKTYIVVGTILLMVQTILMVTPLDMSSLFKKPLKTKTEQKPIILSTEPPLLTQLPLSTQPSVEFPSANKIVPPPVSRNE